MGGRESDGPSGQAGGKALFLGVGTNTPLTVTPRLDRGVQGNTAWPERTALDSAIRSRNDRWGIWMPPSSVSLRLDRRAHSHALLGRAFIASALPPAVTAASRIESRPSGQAGGIRKGETAEA